MAFGTHKTPSKLRQERRYMLSIIRSSKKYGEIGNMRQWLADLDWKDAHPKPIKTKTPIQRTQNRARRRHNKGSCSSASSGDNNDGDPDPDRHQSQQLALLTQADLANILGIALHTLQNQYSKNPHQFPPAIQVPGARGPRWTREAIHNWFAQCPAYAPLSSPPLIHQPKRGVGRPRIALIMGKGGAR